MPDLLRGRVEEIAPRLLGATVTSHIGSDSVTARVVEVEAYGGEDDPASHAYRGTTARNASMFGPPGMCYIYFTYGMHWCLNVAVESQGRGAAVLLRAGEVVDGHDVARLRRTPPSGRLPGDRDLARGPARLCQALGVDGACDGLDLLDDAAPLSLALPENAPASYESGPRVGIRHAAQRPWRFWLPHEPTVSAYREGAGSRRERGVQ